MDHSSEEDAATTEAALEQASFQPPNPTRKAARLTRLDSPNSNSSSSASSVCSHSPSSCSSTHGYEHASASVSAAVFHPWTPPFKKRYLKTSGGDHFSCLTAPYPPDDPRTARYFELVISKTKAPVYCGNAGKLKGKAIYANTDIKGATRIWTESPFLAMQTEKNKANIQCCQYCFVPLGDHTSEWRDIVEKFHAKRRRTRGGKSRRHCHTPSSQPQTQTQVQSETVEASYSESESESESDCEDQQGMNQVDASDLEYVLQVLKLNRRNCGFLRTACECVCGDLYCSKFCQLRAYHEFHSILCTKGDEASPMSAFMRHMQNTNEIFFLAAKAIARVISRFLVTRDLSKARETIDMFYKKPWYEVVMLEKPLHTFKELDLDDQQQREDSAQDGSGNSHFYAFHGGNHETFGVGTGNQRNGHDHHLAGGHGHDRSDHGASSHENGHVVAPAHALRELLVRTHELILDAIEYNLEYLSKEDQLNGFSVDSLWMACEEVLSFEFFVALFGLFEMNNISMEIDHPFQVLIDILDPDYVGLERDTDGEETSEEHDDEEAKRLAAEAAMAAHMKIRQDPILKRVRQVLEWEDKERALTNSCARDAPSSFSSMPPNGLMSPISSCREGGFVGVDGTALFPIICTMNHSCDPNCTVLYTKNGDAHVVAVRDIKKGEELCICYINIDQDVSTREHHLREYQFKCFCSRCDRERREARAQINGSYSNHEDAC